MGLLATVTYYASANDGGSPCRTTPTPSSWRGDKLSPPGAFSPAPISTFAFTHNAGGNITAALKEDGSCWYYEYDALNRREFGVPPLGGLRRAR